MTTLSTKTVALSIAATFALAGCGAISDAGNKAAEVTKEVKEVAAAVEASDPEATQAIVGQTRESLRGMESYVMDLTSAMPGQDEPLDVRVVRDAGTGASLLEFTNDAGAAVTMILTADQAYMRGNPEGWKVLTGLTDDQAALMPTDQFVATSMEELGADDFGDLRDYAAYLADDDVSVAFMWDVLDTVEDTEYNGAPAKALSISTDDEVVVMVEPEAPHELIAVTGDGSALDTVDVVSREATEPVVIPSGDQVLAP